VKLGDFITKLNGDAVGSMNIDEKIANVVGAVTLTISRPLTFEADILKSETTEKDSLGIKVGALNESVGFIAFSVKLTGCGQFQVLNVNLISAIRIPIFFVQTQSHCHRLVEPLDRINLLPPLAPENDSVVSEFAPQARHLR